jgi:hypothetical protein
MSSNRPPLFIGEWGMKFLFLFLHFSRFLEFKWSKKTNSMAS